MGLELPWQLHFLPKTTANTNTQHDAINEQLFFQLLPGIGKEHLYFSCMSVHALHLSSKSIFSLRWLWWHNMIRADREPAWIHYALGNNTGRIRRKKFEPGLASLQPGEPLKTSTLQSMGVQVWHYWPIWSLKETVTKQFPLNLHSGAAERE